MTLWSERRARAAVTGGVSTTHLHNLVLAELDVLGVAGTVLDFGAGRGELAARACERSGIDRVIAADIAEFKRAPSNAEWLVCDLNEPLPLGDDSIDAVIAVGVLEYLENPFAIAREWYRLVRSSGHVIGTIPNAESLRSLMSVFARGRFAALDNPRHTEATVALLRSDLSRAFVRAGFQQPRFAASGRGGIPRHTSTTWQDVSHGRLRGVRWSDDLLFSARKCG